MLKKIKTEIFAVMLLTSAILMFTSYTREGAALFIGIVIFLYIKQSINSSKKSNSLKIEDWHSQAYYDQED